MKCFHAAKNETALDPYQASKHVARYRHVTLAMCASPGSRLTAAAGRRPPPAGFYGGRPGNEGGTCDASDRAGDHVGWESLDLAGQAVARSRELRFLEG